MQIWNRCLLLSNDRIPGTGFTFLSQTPAKLEKFIIRFQTLDKRQHMTSSSERSETNKVNSMVTGFPPGNIFQNAVQGRGFQVWKSL